VQALQQIGFRLENLDFEFGQGEEMVYYSKTFRLALGLNQTPIQWVPVLFQQSKVACT
jgi:hypothetical protein